MTPITSADNPRYRELLKIATSARDRRKTGLTILDGVHLVEAWRDRHGPPRELVVSRSGAEQPAVQALLASLPALEPLVLADGLFATLSPVDTPTGVLAVIAPPAVEVPGEPGPCVLLESLQDPGNLGTILRSAAAAGIREIYLSRDCVDAWAPRVLRAGMGAHFALHCIAEVDLPAFAAAYAAHHGGTVIATAGDGTTSLYDLDLTGRVAFLFGNEGAGLSPALRAAAGTVATIPMAGGTESLNVAAAAAVCLFERVRQVRARA